MAKFELHLLCAVFCFLSLFGCSKEKPNDAIVTYPEDVSAIADFKCVCSTDHETEFVIENDEAIIMINKESYIIKEKSHKDSIRIVITHEDCGEIEILNNLWYNLFNELVFAR